MNMFCQSIYHIIFCCMTSTCGLVARFITLIPSYCDNATIVCGLVTKFDSRVLRCCGLLTRLSEQVTKSVVVMPRNDHFFDHLPGRIPGHVTKKNNQMPRSCKKNYILWSFD